MVHANEHTEKTATTKDQDEQLAQNFRMASEKRRSCKSEKTHENQITLKGEKGTSESKRNSLLEKCIKWVDIVHK